MILLSGMNFPDAENFFANGLIQGLTSLINYIIELFSSIFNALFQFYDTLSEINRYILIWSASADGADTGLPVLASIGAYRYLVGEGAFYITYVMLMCGCLFTIVKLTYLLYSLFEKVTDKINDNDSKTTSGLIGLVTKFFSQNS